MRLDLLRHLLAARRDGTAAALVTSLGSGAQALFLGDRILGELPVSDAALALIRHAVAGDRNTSLETDSGEIFVEVWHPPLRLVIVGAVHIAQALLPMALLTGYRPVVVDPRSAFCSAARFPGAELVNDWPEEALAQLRPDRRTAIVTLTHDPKIDDPALIAALASDAFYVGALGSRKTQARRLERLAAEGIAAASLGRIHGPVGLRIGGVTPAEIALSILAEMTAVLRGGDALK
jgi:xanthine dehydrogenase accessory factor